MARFYFVCLLFIRIYSAFSWTDFLKSNAFESFIAKLNFVEYESILPFRERYTLAYYKKNFNRLEAVTKYNCHCFISKGGYCDISICLILEVAMFQYKKFQYGVDENKFFDEGHSAWAIKTTVRKVFVWPIKSFARLHSVRSFLLFFQKPRKSVL